MTELGLSPIADNLLMLRYKDEAGRLSPVLTIVKTRGSDHDRGTHPVTVAQGGMRVGPVTHDRKTTRARTSAGASGEGAAKKRPAPRKSRRKRP